MPDEFPKLTHPADLREVATVKEEKDLSSELADIFGKDEDK